DPEAREVPHRTLEARVLRAGDDDGVEPVLLSLRADVGVAALDLLPARQATLPLISCVSARLSGASTPWRSPKTTIAPFRKSISVSRPASTSWSIDGLCAYATSLRAAWSNSSSGLEAAPAKPAPPGREPGGLMSSVIPCASATARPSAITAQASSLVGGSATWP